MKIEKCVKIEKYGRGRPGMGMVLEIRTRGGGGSKIRDFGGRPL